MNVAALIYVRKGTDSFHRFFLERLFQVAENWIRESTEMTDHSICRKWWTVFYRMERLVVVRARKGFVVSI